MMITKIDHVNISVTDIEASKQFYVGLLGFRLEKEGELAGEWIDQVVGLKDVKAVYAQLVLPDADTCLELIHYFHPVGEKDQKSDQANRIGLRHMAFAVQGIEALHQKLKDAGVRISDIRIYNGKKKLCYFIGPDNVILELAEYS